MSMTPAFFFRIEEVREPAFVPENQSPYYYWKPSVECPSQRVAGGVSDKLWACNGQRVFQVGNLSAGVELYRTFSTYYSAGDGFWVLRADAANPGSYESWHRLSFDHEPGQASFLTNAGTEPTLVSQTSNQFWPHMLLPNIYHAYPSATASRLVGELPIFLGLLALSTMPDNIEALLTQHFVGGKWYEHHLPRGWINKRGVCVNVWTCSSRDDIKAYEEGRTGQYFA